MLTKGQVIEKLQEAGVPFEVTEHAPVYTIDEMAAIFTAKDMKDVAKNLFLRDGAGKRHFLVVLREDKTADLKAIKAQLGSSRLSFASPERLMQYLGLTRGAVTPLGILNDQDHEVEILFDEDLKDRRRLGFHPCDNTATVWLSFASLKKIIDRQGNKFRFIKI